MTALGSDRNKQTEACCVLTLLPQYKVYYKHYKMIPVDRDVTVVARVSGRLILAGVDSLRDSELRYSLGLCLSVLIAVRYSKNFGYDYLYQEISILLRKNLILQKQKVNKSMIS